MPASTSDPQFTSLPDLSLPKATMMPWTCAPTSTAACGSRVPVALMVATRSPRFTGAVRNTAGLFPKDR